MNEILSDGTMSGLFKVKLTTIDDIKVFTTTAGALGCRCDVIQGRYRICASSLMGMFSLNLSEPIMVEVENGNYAKYFDRWIVE